MVLLDRRLYIIIKLACLLLIEIEERKKRKRKRNKEEACSYSGINSRFLKMRGLIV